MTNFWAVLGNNIKIAYRIDRNDYTLFPPLVLDGMELPVQAMLQKSLVDVEIKDIPFEFSLRAFQNLVGTLLPLSLIRLEINKYEDPSVWRLLATLTYNLRQQILAQA